MQAFLDKLKYALEHEDTSIIIEEDRQVDKRRYIKFTNRYTVAKLFPNDSPREVLKEELKKLSISEYIETVNDLLHPKRSEFWVFGKKYNSDDVYIKLRVEVVGRNYVYIMSFHFSVWAFKKSSFPYAQGGVTSANNQV